MIDDSPHKQGFYTPGSHLKIHNSSKLYSKNPPDYVLLFAWSFAEEIFKIGKGLDDGDIISQSTFSLEGDIKDIFKRMSDLGFSSTFDIITKGYLLRKQDHEQATNCKRRKPMDSEITIDEINNNTAEYLHNKIRMLTDPYPNAYIKCKDGSKLYLIKSYFND